MQALRAVATLSSLRSHDEHPKEDSVLMGTKKVLKVGMASDSDIVVAEQTVSRLHCSLESTDDGWVIRDLGSTNGTFVNGDRIESPRLLVPSDVVTLGRGIPLTIPEKPTAKYIKGDFDKVQSRPISSQTFGQTRKKNPPSRLVSVSSGVAAVLAILCVALALRGSWRGENSAAVSNQVDQSNASTSITPSTDSIPDSLASVPLKKAEADTNKSVSSQASPYYAFVIQSSDGKERRLLGTAVAIDSHRILTLASIVQAAKEVESSYPDVRLYQVNNSMEATRIAKTIVDPKFAAALAARANFEKELNEKLSQVKEGDRPSLEESLEWSGRFDKVMDEVIRSDFACLIVKETLPSYLSLREVDKIDPKSVGECLLIGFPVILPSPSLTDEGVEKFLIQGAASLRKESTSQPSMLEAETSDFSGLPLESMLCLDNSSRIVGFCVREDRNESLGSRQRCKVVMPEIFWK
jgi:hypothetical protein